MSQPRSSYEIKSTLGKFQVEASKDFPEYLLIRYPKEDCPSHNPDGTVRPFLVHKRTWMRPIKSKAGASRKPVTYTSRACTYCFRPSRHK